MKVPKDKFDSLLDRLIKAKPVKNTEIKSPRPKKAKPPKASR